MSNEKLTYYLDSLKSKKKSPRIREGRQEGITRGGNDDFSYCFSKGTS
jgi:hypothetical protein